MWQQKTVRVLVCHSDVIPQRKIIAPLTHALAETLRTGLPAAAWTLTLALVQGTLLSMNELSFTASMFVRSLAALTAASSFASQLHDKCARTSIIYILYILPIVAVQILHLPVLSRFK